MNNEFNPDGLRCIIDFADNLNIPKRDGIPEKLFDLCLHQPGIAKLLAIGAKAELTKTEYIYQPSLGDDTIFVATKSVAGVLLVRRPCTLKLNPVKWRLVSIRLRQEPGIVLCEKLAMRSKT